MRRPRAWFAAGLDSRLSRILQGALVVVELPKEARRQLLRSAARLERDRAWRRERLYDRAQESMSLWDTGAAPVFGWMTLPLSQNYLLGFPKPRFSW
jgi:hypothetical protein